MVKRVKVDNLKNDNSSDIKNKDKVKKSDKTKNSKLKSLFDTFKQKKNSKKSDAVKKYQKNKNKKAKQKRYVNGKFSLDILELLIIVVFTALIACIATGLILNHQYKKNFNYIDTDIMDNKKIVEFLETYSEIVDNFYEDVDGDKIIDAALEGMLEYLEDNYSIFLDKNESSDLTESLDGAYEGIGIVAIGNVVYNVYEGSPAEKAGILAEDEIIEINGTKVSLENYEKITELLYKDKENKIIVLRDGKEFTFNIEVSKVKVPSVSTNIIVSEDKKQNIGYLALTTFSAHSYEEFQTELLELEKDGIDSLIIDLRDNTGGYLNVVSDITELFLEKGDVIYSLKNKDEKKVYKDKTKDSRNYKIVVLVNANTASASEILAAALHDSYGAEIVGKTTYGKGKVQTVKQYDDSIVKYTSAEWFRPNGECVDEIGIKPDYDVDLEYGQNVIYDLQLDKAIELLS